MPAARTYHRFRLDNGLRVVAVPDPGSPLVTTAVHYDVGWRAEAPDRNGFAHLFEHLMFEGSPSLPRGDYKARLAGVGGSFTAFTRGDFTCYWSQVPVEHADLSVSCEADRMRGITADTDALANQVSVVKEEIRVNIRNQPYGGFPFFDVPGVLFDSFANSHDGYGDFTQLERTTLDEVAAFFDEAYQPANAVVTITGGLSAEALDSLVRRHFAEIPSASALAHPDLDEPEPTGDRHHVRPDAHAPLPAVVMGFRVPDPVAEPADYVATFLLDRLLTAGEDAVLHERLVRRDGLASTVVGWYGLVDQPFGTRHPSLDSLVAYLAPAARVEQVVAAIDEELLLIADGAVDADGLARLVAGERVRYWNRLDPQVYRAIELGMHEVVHGDARRLDTLPELFGEVTVEAVAAAAKRMVRPGRAIVECRPEASS